MSKCNFNESILAALKREPIAVLTSETVDDLPRLGDMGKISGPHAESDAILIDPCNPANRTE